MRTVAHGAVALLLAAAFAHAGNLSRTGISNSSSNNKGTSSTSQTTTPSTDATAQAAQTARTTQMAQVSLQRSVQAMQVINAQTAAQSAARNLIFSGGNTTANSIPNGIATGGLMPLPPSTGTTTVHTTVNPDGTTSLVLGANSGITLPPSVTGNDQITVSGTGTVGSVTNGSTITPLTAGTATTVAPGSTITLTQGGTINFAAGSAAVPLTFSTFSYAPSSSWSGVAGVTQSTYGSGVGQNVAVTLTQDQQQALLNWQTFNIGLNTTLDFDQSAGGKGVANWVVINKVASNIAPSQVFGAIQAPGQVYVINQNGIIFGGSSQVNTGALVAASLPINDNLVQNGLLSNPDYQFLFSQLDLSAGTQGPTSAFQPEENTPAPGANGSAGGTVAHVDSQGNLSLVSASGIDGDVVVQQGARLSSPAAQNVGGRIALVGPNVNNAGTISTPDGQTILAAGTQVGFQAHNANDPSLRGLDTYVGAVTDPAVANPAYATGVASNTGIIGMMNTSGSINAAPGADVTLTGKEVDQFGLIDLSTTVNFNSRVDLLADYDGLPFIKNVAGFSGTTNFYPTSAGAVTLGAGSLTELTPDLSSTDTVVGTQLALSSLVNIQGATIDLQSNAMLIANSAQLPSSASQPALGISGFALKAGVTLDAGQWTLANGNEVFLNNAGTVSLEQGAIIDASGSQNVNASVAEDVVALQLLGAQLANSPLQQDGALRGTTVYVDLRNVGTYNGTAWIGTPLADASGYVNLVQRTVGELTTAGGTVAINAGGSVAFSQGSTVDVSGGWINYQGGTVQTTNVVSNGVLINIAQANPDLVYSGIYRGFTLTESKYGLSQSYSSPFLNGTQYDPGYIQGGAGGSLSITASSMVLDGQLSGNIVQGAYQRASASAYTSASSVFAADNVSYLPTILAALTSPKLASLSLTFGQEVAAGVMADPAQQQNIDIGSSTAVGDLVLPTHLTTTDGFGSLLIDDPTGNITLPANTPLVFAPGGSLTVKAGNIDLESSITSPGGNLNFTAYLVSPNDTVTSAAIPPPDANSPAGAVSSAGNFTMGAGASLETGGLVVDDFDSSGETLAKVTNGGSVSIDGYSVFLHPGSQIDASGGIYVSNADAITYGQGGSISITAGQDPTNNFLTGGQIQIGSTLTAYSGVIGGGGSLEIIAPLIQIGGALSSGLQNGDLNTVIVQQAPGVYGNGNTLWLDPSGLGLPDFFSQGGLENFTIKGIGEARLDAQGQQIINPATGEPFFDPALLVAPGTTISPLVESSLYSHTTGLVPNTAALEAQLLPSQRSSVNLAFGALGVNSNPNLTQQSGIQARGDIVIDTGSVIETGPQAVSSSNGVSLSAPLGTITVLGDIFAPGGTISVSAASNSTDLLLSSSAGATPTVELGSQSELSTAGVAVPTFNTAGFNTGSVLNGGTITIKGNIVAEDGSVLDVSGASGTFDVLPAQALSNPTISLRGSARISANEASNAGSISLSGGQELFSDATLIGVAGGPSAHGGSLLLSSGGIYVNETPLDATLIVTQSGATFVQPASGQSLIGQTVVATHPENDVDGDAIEAYFAADPNIFATTPAGAGNGGRAGGFQALTINRTVEFSGPVTIKTSGSISIGATSGGDTVSGGVIIADSPVVLQAPLVSLGLSFTAPSPPASNQQVSLFENAFNPSSGPGILTINSSALTEIGNLSLQDIGAVNFNTTLSGASVTVAGGRPIPITGNGMITSTSGGSIRAADGTVTTLQAGVATTVAAGSFVTPAGNGSITPNAVGIIPAGTAGDIVGQGTFDVQGTIAISAGQVYSPTESIFSIFGYDYNGVTGNSSIIFTSPLQEIALPTLPLSAGSTLNIYASNILQAGVLRAPDGTINLGVGLGSALPIDYFTGSGVGGATSISALPVPATDTVVLAPSSITSVSLIDPATGQGITVPYGIINDSGNWIDPAGNNITTATSGGFGLPSKSIKVAGQSIVVDTGSTIDLRGGGDLFAYDFVSGTGGTNDILSSNSSFAVVPGYSLGVAPYGAYASSTSLQTNGVADAGYSSSGITAGEQIYLNGSNGLPAGVYTVLPARYALMPGAYLVSPAGISATSSTGLQANGSTFVTGYEFDGLTNSTAAPPLYSEFKVESRATVLGRADYEISSANTFFPQAAAANQSVVPRVPMDAGQLVLAAGSLSLPTAAGSLLDSTATGGRGGEVDIASSGAINIDNASVPATFDSTPGVLNLSSDQLTEFGAASLLIGGYRSTGEAGASLATVGSAVVIPSSGGTITFPSGTPGDDVITVSGTGVVGTYTTTGGVTTAITGGSSVAIPAGSVLTLSSGGTVTFSGGTSGAIPLEVATSGTGVSVTSSLVTVNNAGTALSGDDVILVSNGSLVIDAGSSITATAGGVAADQLSIVGNGSLLRVGGDSSASISRSSVHSSVGVDPAQLQIGVITGSTPANAVTTITGSSVILDSTNQTSLVPQNLVLHGTHVALDSGQITIELSSPTVAPITTGLVLSGDALAGLQSSASQLSLLSYSSIDLYSSGAGTIGGAGSSQGVYPVSNLALHAADIRGFDGGDVTINAGTVMLDNSPGSTSIGSSSAADASGGTLTINANTIDLGMNALKIDQFAQVDFNAASALVLTGLGVTGSADAVPTASSLTVTGNLQVDSPLITAQNLKAISGSSFTTYVDQSINAAGSVVLNGAAAIGSVNDSGLGNELQVTGSSVAVDTNIVLHSGTVLLASNGTGAGSNTTVGANGAIDVSGEAPNIYNLTKYTNGGAVTIVSVQGNVEVDGAVDVSAQSGLGTADSQAANAGSLTAKAQNGTFIVTGSILGNAGVVHASDGSVLDAGNGGSLTLDVGALSSASLASLESILNPTSAGAISGDTYVGGFTNAQNIRVRNGSLTIDGVIAASTLDISVDNGFIAVSGTGRLDATSAVNGLIDTTTAVQDQGGSPVTVLAHPGATGGQITLAAGTANLGATDSATGIALGSVVLQSGSFVSAAGLGFNNAGKGGAVALQAGSDINGSASATGSARQGDGTFGSGVAVADVEQGATIDLSVRYLPIQLVTSGSSSVTLATAGAIFFPNGTPGSDRITISGSGTVGQLVTSSGTTSILTGGVAFSVPAGSTLQLAQAGSTVSFAAGGSGGAIQVNLPAAANFTSNGAANLSGNAALTAANQGDLSGTLLLQAPQTVGSADVQVDPIDGTVVGASSIVVGGLHVQNANATGSVSLDNVAGAAGVASGTNYKSAALANATSFMGNYSAMAAALVGTDSQGVSGNLVVQPVEEIDNTKGGLGLNDTWDFSQSRYGPDGTLPGTLVLRALNGFSVLFGASINDGFDLTHLNVPNENYTAPLMNGASWSYDFVAGADFSAADASQVRPGATGSFILGLNAPSLPTTTITTASTILATQKFYQTIRSGTGSITIDAGGNVQINNEIATIYTGGTTAPDVADFEAPVMANTTAEGAAQAAQYAFEGGNITISALGNIGRTSTSGAMDSSKELPTSWLYRQGAVSNGIFAINIGDSTTVESTSWWVDYANFFEGVGTLGGGNITLVAGANVVNLDAVAPTNARMPGTDGSGNAIAPSQASLVELGGGDVTIQAGNNIDAGVYYVEKGQGSLAAGNSIDTNATRATLTVSANASTNQLSWMATTLFAGDANFSISANGDLLLGPVANPFLLPQNIGNSTNNKSYFSTYATTDSVNVSALTGDVTLQDDPDTSANSPGNGSLFAFYNNVYLTPSRQSLGTSSQPWLQLVETSLTLSFNEVSILMPATLRATSYGGDINVVGTLLLSPSPIGTVDLAAAGSVNGFQPNVVASSVETWGSSLINLSDVDPASIPSPALPLSSNTPRTTTSVFTALNALFAESGATVGVSLQTESNLHADINGAPLHANDSNPVYIYAAGGDISGLTLFSGKFSDLVASQNIQDIGLYLQNDNASDITVVDAGGSITAYDSNSTLRSLAQAAGNALLGQSVAFPLGTSSGAPNTGDIQIGGPGTLEVLAGNNVTLGNGPANTTGPNNTSNGTDTGITSIGNLRNPSFSPNQSGADVVVGSGLGGVATNVGQVGLAGADPATAMNFAAFENDFLNPNAAQSARYLPDLAVLMNLPPGSTPQETWTAFNSNSLTVGQRDNLALQIYYLVLRDSGRDHNAGLLDASNYENARQAVTDLFPNQAAGDIALSSREIKTESGGNINLFAPGGSVIVGVNLTSQPVDQGVLTDAGGNINIFVDQNVDVGTSRIFTLDGGNIVIYSSNGNIAAGSASKTVQSAPPTRVLVDPRSGAVQTDLAGLATGGGIGVLESQTGAQAADIDLIAPNGTVDAGDAGIRVSGNLNIAAVQVLNAGNIAVGGKSSGVPATTSPNIAGLAAASSAAGAGANEASTLSQQQRNQANNDQTDLPSIVTVEVLGYGGA